MKRKQMVDEMTKLKTSKECQEKSKVSFDKNYEKMQMKAMDMFVDKNPVFEDKNGKMKYVMKIMIQHTNLFGRNFPKHNAMFNPAEKIGKDICDSINRCADIYAEPRNALGFWNIVNGDTKKVDYMYASFDDGAIMPICKKSQEFRMNMVW